METLEVEIKILLKMARPDWMLYIINSYCTFREEIKFVPIDSVLHCRTTGVRSHCPRTLNMYRIYYNHKRQRENVLLSLFSNRLDRGVTGWVGKSPPEGNSHVAGGYSSGNWNQTPKR